MDEKARVLSLIVAAFVLVIAGVFLFRQLSFLAPSVGCTEEAKLCPDGSAVGRVPPKCEFSPCPELRPGVANPASVYCEKLGGTLEIIQEEPGPNGGGQVGMCALPGGKTCEEGTLYRGECAGFPGADGTEKLNPAAEKLCSASSDCVPAGGCHPTECVNSKYFKENNNLACTAVCMGPLDCGAGRCECVLGKCAVVPKG